MLPAQADLIDLGDGARLSGNIVSIDSEGRVTVDSELSESHLLVRPEAVKTIRLDPAIDDKLTVPDQEIQLTNGDAIPCRVIAMDARKVEISTWFAGKLEVPRTYVSALHFGISKPKAILAARKALEGWSKSDAWKIDPESLTISSSDTGRISRTLGDPLPEQCIIRFRYQWKGDPNFRFHFAADELGNTASNRYILTINTAGLEVKRQSPKGRTYTTLSLSPKRPSEAWPEGMDVELRIDRKLSEPLFLLFINGNLVDRFSDAVKNPPRGLGMMFESGARRGSSNIIKDFEILEWNGDSASRRKREESAPGQDAVYDNQGEHFSGKAESITEYKGRPVIVFRHPHAEEPLRIPLEMAASLWFAEPKKAPDIAATPLVIGLVDNGLLHVASCALDDRRLECTHPLLGKLFIKRRAVSTIKHGKKQEKP